MDPNDYFYAWKPAIFRKATRHLTALQRGIYRDLIDEYMETREPLPDNDIALANIARISVEEWTHVKKEILEFFVAQDGKLFHDFCNDTLDQQDVFAKKRSKASKKAASKRWEHKRKPKMPDASETQCEPDANGMPQNAIGKERKGKDILSPLVPLKISEQLWQEYKTHRKQKRSTLNAVAERRALAKLERLQAEGNDPSRVIEQTLENGWIGLFELKTEGKKNGNGKYTAADALAEVIREIEADSPSGGTAFCDTGHLRQIPGTVENPDESHDRGPEVREPGGHQHRLLDVEENQRENTNTGRDFETH